MIDLDDELKQLIESSFDSVWTLELLLLLCSAPRQSRTVQKLVDELRSSELIVRTSLKTLRTGGLVLEADDGTVQYAPVTPTLDAVVARLVEDYRTRPDTIRRIIVAPPTAKLKVFSDAFLFRKPSK